MCIRVAASPDGPLTSLAMPPKIGRAARRFMGGLGSKSASEPGEEGSIAPRPGRRMLGCLHAAGVHVHH